MRPIVPVFALLVVVSLGAPQRQQQPHIVWLTVDGRLRTLWAALPSDDVHADLGWCDFAWTGSGSDVLSPTLSKLAAEGTVLNNYYVTSSCSQPHLISAAAPLTHPVPASPCAAYRYY